MARFPARSLITVGLLLAAAGLPSASCESDDPQACDKISDACHELDKGPGSGKPHECHRISHTNDVSQCNKNLDDCVSFCNAQPRPDGGARDGAAGTGGGTSGTGGTGGSGGSGGSGGTGGSRAPDARPSSPDGPAPDSAPAPAPDARTPDSAPAVSSACMSYCACMTKQCASKAGAPAWVKDPALCPTQCATFSAQQLMCWSGFCNPNAAMVSEHNCEHAWGALGVAECN